MTRRYGLFLSCGMVFLLGVGLACAQSSKPTSNRSSVSGTTSTRTTPSSATKPAEKPSDPQAPLPGAAENTTNSEAEKPAEKVTPEKSSEPSTLVRWYGHAFVYLVNSSGVRVAMDPYARNSVKYLFPGRLPADTVLISCEADDHAAGEQLFGTPQIFRSYTAIGVNKANGLIFKGVSVNRDGRLGLNAPKCTAFVFELDGVTFAHLGVVGNVLDSRQRQDIGRVDVLFLPVGNPSLTLSDLNRIAADLQAKVIVPITYKTDLTPNMNLRTLDDYLKDQKLPIKRLDKPEFPVNEALLPSQPTIYIPALP